MANDNSVFVIGNCTRDPELRFTNSGKAVASFGVAWSTRRRTPDGKWEDGDTSFVDVTCWDQLAENVCESVQKGNRVVINGRLQQRSWEDKNSGDKRSKVEIVAEDVSPSLRWATAQVERNAPGGGGSGGGNRGGASGGSSDGSSDGSSNTGSGGGGSYNDDEEPF